jgi:hypothetical protein
MIFVPLLPNTGTMKKISSLLLITGSLLLFFISCSKSDNDDDLNVYVFPPDAAAKYITMAFCINSGGIDLHLENAASIAGRMTSGAFDSTFKLKQTDSTLVIRYIYDGSYNANYLAGTPPKIDFSYTETGAFNSAVMSSDDQQSGDFMITGLDSASTSLVMNGSGSDGGLQQSGSYNVSFNSSFNYTLKDVLFDKNTHQITSGTATIHIDGVGPANIPFGYGGSITFSGNRKATLVLSGTTYTMNLETGGASK